MDTNDFLEMLDKMTLKEEYDQTECVIVMLSQLLSITKYWIEVEHYVTVSIVDM